MSKAITIPEEVAERKVIVYKPRIDIKNARATAEKMKTQLFRKLVFMKPKPEEVQLVSISRYFDPYVVVDGEYTMDYSKNWVHNIQVDDTMEQLTLFGETVKTKTLRGNLQIPCKILQLAGEGRYKVTIKARLIFDKEWREVGLEDLPFVPFEEKPKKILSSLNQEIETSTLITEKEVDILKSRIVKRPTDILCIHNELFKVFERAIIYKPMYEITVRNFKTEKETTLTIDAITGKTAKGLPQTPTLKKKEKATTPKKESTSKKTDTQSFQFPKEKLKTAYRRTPILKMK